MAEPMSPSVAGAAMAAGAITLTGSIFGMQYDALLFGLFGGLISLMHLPPMGMVRVVSTLFSASLMGAVFGPAGVAAAQANFAWVKAVPAEPARLGSALLIGLFLQALIQLAMRWLQARGGAGGEAR